MLADDYWSAHQGQAALTIEWEDSLFETFDSSTLAARGPRGSTIRPRASCRRSPTAIRRNPCGRRAIEASYAMPHKAANPLEPINLTVWARNGGIEYWGGLQVPSTAMEAAEVIGGIPSHRVTLHELVSGGSFGARESKYWLFEATWLAVNRQAREADEQPRGRDARAVLSRGKLPPCARGARCAGQSRVAVAARRDARLAAAVGPGYLERADRMDFSTTEAITKWEFAYAAPHRDIGWIRMETGVPTGWFRAVSYIPNVFAVESVMDEAAQARPGRVPARAHARPAAPCGRAA